ncbi:transmembrane protein, putative [Medicago truncatula]|uniref:Transmembrane protein, putative n=1 Tax=Medicago truncatula TaxID=3880 RepID=G7L3S0_MEDTR|nr:transmembrane protein, putative [Medicago truncatula]
MARNWTKRVGDYRDFEEFHGTRFLVVVCLWLYVLNVTITGHLYDKEANNQLEALGQRRKKKA